MTKILAIANCRVSSDEQLLNGSLGRQNKSVEQKARELKAELVHVWSGATSSKKGVNVDRTDLEEMVQMCKSNKRIKYVIIDELDRFMRSMLEIGYFLVIFKQLGVEVVFASQPNLTTNSAADTLMLMLEAYKAEGSNEERQRKSISGQTAALNEGRYTFHPKPGYKKGVVAGIHEVHPTRGPALRYILKKLASGIITPTNALIELNESKFTRDHSLYKMDKFRRIATDGFYAGIVKINQQVKVTNPNGLHKPLITVAEHERIVEIFNGRPKNQMGPNMKGNPAFPASNLLAHDSCLEHKSRGRLVGLNLSNGKSAKVYEKYRCRSCKRYLRKEDLHHDIADLFRRYEMSDDVQSKILKALDVVWQQDAERVNQELKSMRLEIVKTERSIDQKVEDATDPSNYEIKEDLLKIVRSKKEILKRLKSNLAELEATFEADKLEFMKFALSFIEDVGEHFLETYVSKENRLRCKQMLFPAGIFIDQKNKVYTPEISVFYRLATNKKDLPVTEKSSMVRVRGL